MNHIRKSIFILRLEGKPGTGIRALRWLLKRLLRQHGLRCLDAHEESAPVRDPANEVADAFAGLRRDVHRRVRTAPPKIHELPAGAGADSGMNASAPNKETKMDLRARAAGRSAFSPPPSTTPSTANDRRFPHG
jgi:hypothetical protein